MPATFKTLLLTVTFIFSIQQFAMSAISEELQKSIDKVLPDLKKLSSDPQIVTTVKNHNVTPPSEAIEMTNETWKTLTILSAVVKSFTTSEIGKYIKSIKSDYISEMFINTSNGNKVTFLSKTTSWNHSGNPKHDMPMKGKMWIGEREFDESSGEEQIQIGLPVLDGKTPVGSIIIGLSITKLKALK
jgi:hypothetical protein